MSNKLQVIICGVLLSLISIWAYYYQFEAHQLLEDFDYSYAQVWQQPWRLVTAHFLHLTTLHWVGNVLAFTALTVFLARHFTVRTYLNALLLLTAGSSVILWLAGYQNRFVGLSAVNHGLLIMGILLELRGCKTPSQKYLLYTAGALLGLKWLAEFLGWWQSPLVTGQDQQLWQLHGAGILSGILAWWLHNRHLAKLAQPSGE
ncbi:rhomboid family intramembrane serine protease [Pseudidiomarina terrestris]|uniref:Rhomboid family intramembrane serine protease n=1 Tax=Pseudidiomarina terrestris TaxID=2820060 RepID=A0AAW7QZD6_9GAMM|nr:MULTISPECIES: rhomboid family intramembrane serine protease [unclassified Pseudidiomarina]MDN7124233.1 rhomboid family intramembrane serine protease [Pseudidiomarina sp. 1APP75-32.1]MDN7127300.1 rhomboid family intramembrane serine protease [Pseudidiomarina sp. 1APR75-33.1]MDN7128490.1 rhomboid family intramembrane serine protease [Pseudidiomarina sp. 1APR75-15]MDN7135262.1 rhomboid family intramembrane serine protease [Pseudidiomarina sp. 1ASP75-5]MDN7138679.1 rhomboid family intramembrane